MQLQYILAAVGLVALVGVFVRMKEGFGPNNLRIVGIVLIATFASVLAVHGDSALTAGMGILGAIAGYLFGVTNKG
jgi:hypothetical protein